MTSLASLGPLVVFISAIKNRNQISLNLFDDFNSVLKN